MSEEKNVNITREDIAPILEAMNKAPMYEKMPDTYRMVLALLIEWGNRYPNFRCFYTDKQIAFFLKIKTEWVKNSIKFLEKGSHIKLTKIKGKRAIELTSRPYRYLMYREWNLSK